MGFWYKVRNFFYYGWKYRDTVNFDAHSLYYVIYIKLEKIYNVFIKHGHLEWNKNENTKGMRKLRQAINLAKRLSEHNYFSEHLNVLEKKYGKIKFKGTKMSFENAKEGMPKVYASKQFLTVATKSDSIEKEEHKRLFLLLTKYLQHWWD